MVIGVGHAIVLTVALLRLAELVHARRNETRLRAAGGIEHGAGHYPLFVLLHAAWLATLLVLAGDVSAIGLAVFALGMGLRLWAIAILGARWSTRVIVLPGETLVRAGPYRWLRHPNYLGVAIELYALGFAVGAPWAGLLFGTLNLPLLAWRIRVEDRALAGVR